MNLSGGMRGIYAVCEWIMRFAVLNGLWLAVNFPILLIVWSMWNAISVQDIILLSIPLFCLFPILFYPATAGLFAVVRDWIMTEAKDNIVKAFFGYIRENYKKSFLAGVFFGIVWTITAVNYVIANTSSTMLAFVLLFFALLLFIITILFFALLVHYQLSTVELIKKSLLYTFGCPLLSITIMISVLIVILMSLQFPFLIVFFSWSFIAFITFSAFYRTFLRLTEKKA